jgi:hypothetical protein
MKVSVFHHIKQDFQDVLWNAMTVWCDESRVLGMAEQRGHIKNK